MFKEVFTNIESSFAQASSLSQCLAWSARSSTGKHNIAQRSSSVKVEKFSLRRCLRLAYKMRLKSLGDNDGFEDCEKACTDLDCCRFTTSWPLGNIEISDLQVGKLLGAGGFGTVYEVVYHGKRYALKQWHKSTKNRRATEESFEAEVSTLRFRHPNIVRALCVLHFHGYHSLIMEYGGEKNLQELINCPSESLDNSRSVNLALDISRGLAFAHRQGLAHLDLKPSNVLVSSRDHCKLADFGCCQNVGGNERPASPTKSSLTGTFAYRAPELLKGECPTTKADIYSLGICLWQMLTRERPYGRENQHVVIFAVVAYQHRPKIPDEDTLKGRDKCYAELIKNCWQADSLQRPSARQLVKILKHWNSFCEPHPDLWSADDLCITSTFM